MYFSFWCSHIEKCWRWCLEAYSGMGGGNAIPYIPMTLIPEQDCWDGHMHIFFFFFYCGKKKCAMFQHQVVSGLFWWAGRYLGWVGHFCVLQLLKWQQTGLGTRVKLLYSAMWQWSGKKDPSPLPGPSPKDPRVQCSTRPWITMHHRPRSRGLLGSKHCELYSNILSHFHVHVCEQAVNISSHCIIHLMQYLIRVHGITNVCLFLLHTIKFIVICKKNKQVI